MPRQYNTLGRRILSLLEIGGPRKLNVLLGLAAHHNHDEASLKRTLDRLVTSRLIERRSHCRGGVHFAIARRKA